jgi:hypothetical protein
MFGENVIYDSSLDFSNIEKLSFTNIDVCDIIEKYEVKILCRPQESRIIDYERPLDVDLCNKIYKEFDENGVLNFAMMNEIPMLDLTHDVYGAVFKIEIFEEDMRFKTVSVLQVDDIVIPLMNNGTIFASTHLLEWQRQEYPFNVCFSQASNVHLRGNFISGHYYTIILHTYNSLVNINNYISRKYIGL